jgi:NADH:ubiquinone oxidoreductase subunit
MQSAAYVSPGEPLPGKARPSVRVAVVMEREANPNEWEAWRFRLIDVVPHEDAFGLAPRVLRDDGKVQRTLYPNFTLELFRDEGEGYFLNLSSGAPVWFVMWRIDDEDPARAWPETVSLSYNEAGRWLDAQERVDNVPLPPDLVAWLQSYTDEHYRPEPKKRRRPQSFVSPGERRS